MRLKKVKVVLWRVPLIRDTRFDPCQLFISIYSVFILFLTLFITSLSISAFFTNFYSRYSIFISIYFVAFYSLF